MSRPSTPFAKNRACSRQPGIAAIAPPVVSNTRAETLHLYQAGHSLEAIAQLRNLRRTTVLGHIVALLAAGEAVNLDDFVSPERQATIRQAIEETESPYLNAVRDRLGDDYSYDEIRLVQGALRGATARS